MIRRASTFAAVRPTATTSSSLFGAAAVTAPLLATSHRFASGGGNKNPYKTLGVKTGADRAIVKKAYRVMAKKYHPDAPGGSHEKFQEIQMAYEQVKTGVWVPTDEGGNAKATNRYQGMNFTTTSSKGQNRSYEDFFREMHTGRETQFDEEGPEVPKSKAKKGPMGANEDRVQAWFRLIGAWATIFCTLRVMLIFVFPPKYQQHKKKPMSDMPGRGKPAPPKPLVAPALA